MGTRGSFPGVKRQGREADHSPPSSADIKNAWSYTSTPPIRLHDVVLSLGNYRACLYLYIYLYLYLYLGWEDVDWMHMAQDRDQRRAVVNEVMYLWIP
jgi:hypothetical protein